MNHEEIKSKDWQLLTAHSLLVHTAYLKTILSCQASILSMLEKRPVSEVTAELQLQINEEYKRAEQVVRNEIPDYK